MIGRPKHTEPSLQAIRVIALYSGGKTMRETARECNISLGGVQQTLKRWAPAIIRAPYLHKRQQGISA